MGRNILIFSAILAISPAALAQDIYGNSGSDLYGNPANNSATTGAAGAAIEQSAAQEEAAEAAMAAALVAPLVTPAKIATKRLSANMVRWIAKAAIARPVAAKRNIPEQIAMSARTS